MAKELRPLSPEQLAGVKIPGPAIKSRHAKERDEYGFGMNTENSFIIQHLQDGDHTRKSLLDAFLKAFCSKDDSAGNIRRKKTSFSVFLSDVRRPFGMYHGSRSLIIIEDPPKTGKLSLDPQRAGLVKKAIHDGVLEDLCGLNRKLHSSKINHVLRKYGLPDGNDR